MDEEVMLYGVGGQWRQPVSASLGQKRGNTVPIMGSYIAIRSNDLSAHRATLMDLKVNVLLKA